MAILRRPQFGWTLNWAAFLFDEGNMLLMFPVQLIMSGMSADSLPLLVPNQSGDIWPVFADKESCAYFLQASVRMGRVRGNWQIAEFDSATNLLAFMRAFRLRSVETVWADGRRTDSTNVQFSVRLPVEQFLAELEKQASSEESAGTN